MLNNYISVFLSHSSKDKPYVEEFYRKIRTSQVKVWCDKFNIIPGEFILSEINSGIDQSDILILFVSKSSLNSSWVKYEWESYLSQRLSEKKQTYLIPILLDKIKVPNSLKKFKYLQCDKNDINPTIKELANAIKAIIIKQVEEKKGYKTLEVNDREVIINKKTTTSERQFIIKVLKSDLITLEFHQWQIHPGKIELIRISIVDHATNKMIEHKAKIVSHSKTAMHVTCEFKPKHLDQIISAYFHISADNYYKNIFSNGYSQMDFLMRFPISSYSYLMAIPRLKEFENITVEALYRKRKVKMAMIKTVMERVYNLKLDNILPLDELTIIANSKST